MKIALTALILIIGTSLFAQTKTDRLINRMTKSGSAEFQRVRVEFNNNVDCYYWNNQFKLEKTPSQLRPQKIISKLMIQAEESQADLLKSIYLNYSNAAQNIRSYWIINIIVLEAKPALIEFISNYPGVSLVDLEESKIQMNEHFKIESSDEIKAIGAPEPGLVAINAPALWAMGYTGKGTIVYDYDTGVWPDHPAFKNRFMGNFYPMDQSWLGYYKPLPTGVYSSHGTHTLGTIAGLDTATNDTIGAAFNSYWIACDHIRGSVGELPPLTEMIDAFQWALDPDGDPLTSSDIPDVINNSWRWYDDADTVYCGGIIVNLMNAIEAAGIANVFSGGNFGPSNTTISSPQRINTSDVNTFSVGSVNGNTSFPYPISSFSSIGPKQCPGSGSLSIHPEVVAPGQNVRSAWGPNGYNSISGTSMAAPHVSGACLLLKEAFPAATGEDILRALYLSATDLGIAGEDNTYGMGLIDCLAAFNELALTFTPTNPNAIDWDLAIVNVSSPDEDEITCNTLFTPSVTVINQGDSTITGISIFDSILGIANSIAWTGSLLSGQQTTISLGGITVPATGLLSYLVEATVTDAGASDFDPINNRRINRFNVRSEFNLPYLEKFESGITADWVIENEDDSYGWESDSTAGLPWSNLSATVQLFWYNPIVNQEDALISPNVSTAGASNLYLKFDHAFEDINSASRQDTLSAYISTDCGATWSNPVYKKWGSDLATVDTINVSFIPSLSEHWVTDSVNISTFVSNPTVMVKFVTKNRKGQNLYLDNVRIYDVLDPVGSVELKNEAFSIFPNPSSGNVTIKRETTENAQVKIYSATGVLVRSLSVKGKLTHFSIEDLSNGLYIIDLAGKQKSVVLNK
ncbi:MAG: hypothetical protein ACI9J3_000801 [Parvicellaceae bacterium]|jgi:hypothetical protein